MFCEGQAYGFKLSSLSQLTRSRSTDNKVTLMEYLYLYLEKTQPEVIKFTEEWSALNEAVSVDIPTLRSGVAQIGAKLNLIQRRVEAAAKGGALPGLYSERFSMSTNQKMNFLVFNQSATCRILRCQPIKNCISSI